MLLNMFRYSGHMLCKFLTINVQPGFMQNISILHHMNVCKWGLGKVFDFSCKITENVQLQGFGMRMKKSLSIS